MIYILGFFVIWFVSGDFFICVECDYIVCIWLVLLGEESEFLVWIDWWVIECCKWINVELMFCDVNNWFLNEFNFFVLKFFLFLLLCFI